jgi:hypothetical protein
MKNKVKVSLMMFALLLGLSVTATAQSIYGRRRDGRQVVTVYPNGRRIIRRDNGRTIYRRPNGRTVVVLPNGNRVIRSSRSRQSYPQVSRAHTYRLPSGRLVTVLPNGRRIYH